MGGALLWSFLFVSAGFFLGNLPAVKHNFTLVVLGIVAVGPPYCLSSEPPNTGLRSSFPMQRGKGPSSPGCYGHISCLP